METNEDGAKASPDEDKEDENNENRVQTNEDGNVCPNGIETNKPSVAPVKRDSKAGFKNDPEPEIEGEDQEISKEPVNLGPTLTRYQYDKIKDDYDDLTKNLRDNAMKTMLKMLELQASQRPNQRMPSLAAGSSQKNLSTGKKASIGGDVDIETQMKELEQKLKHSITRIGESKREQVHLMSLINNLEVQMFRTEEAECIKEMMSKVPDEADLEKMKRLQFVMMERKRLEREIQRLQMEIRAMNNAMASADVIISESAPIKKPRRVVIQEASNHQLENPVEYGSTSVRGEWPRGKAPSPELDTPESAGLGQDNEESDDARKQSTESDDEEVVNESEVKATPPTTKGKKSKK